MALKKAKPASAEGMIEYFEKNMTDAERFNLANDPNPRFFRFLLNHMSTDILDKFVKATLKEYLESAWGQRTNPLAADRPLAADSPDISETQTVQPI